VVEVGGQPGIWVRFDVAATQRMQLGVGCVHFDRVTAAVDRDADVRHDAKECPEMVARSVLERSRGRGDAGCDDERARFDAVRHDPVVGARSRRRPSISILLGAVRSTSAPMCCRKSIQIGRLPAPGPRAR